MSYQMVFGSKRSIIPIMITILDNTRVIFHNLKPPKSIF